MGSPAGVSRKNSTSQSRSAPRVGQPWERAAQRLRQFRNRGMPRPLLLGFHLEKPGSWHAEGLILGLLSSRTALSAAFGPWHPAPALLLSLLLSVASPRGSLVKPLKEKEQRKSREDPVSAILATPHTTAAWAQAAWMCPYYHSYYQPWEQNRQGEADNPPHPHSWAPPWYVVIEWVVSETHCLETNEQVTLLFDRREQTTIMEAKPQESPGTRGSYSLKEKTFYCKWRTVAIKPARSQKMVLVGMRTGVLEQWFLIWGR